MLRLQHINIYRATSVDIDALDYSACSLPLLHTFYVEHEGEEVPSLCSFLKQDFPRLQSLRVVHCNIPRRVYSFPRLVSLTLDGSIDRLPVLTISDILATIEATPKLEYIHLSYVVMPLSHVDAENLTAFQRDPIEAPSLLFFKTTSSHFDATYSISTIKHHSQSQFPRYELKSTATPVKTITQAQILNVSEFCAQSPPSSLTVDLFPNQLCVLVDDAVYMEFPSSCSHRSVNATHRLLSAISPDEIKSLVFTDNTSGIYADFLHLWPNIETLDISTDETYLTQVWEKLKGHNHLEGITIFGMDLEVVVNNDPSPLVEFLRSRAESGVPIKKLRSSAHERRHPKAEMVEKLKQFTDVDVVI
ncbi:hypothetical protein ONZ45_g3867 [Pleurotus djamor]|nr:hypothetical protein ONZ45_g3867 [Pleurotus djamor]